MKHLNMAKRTVSDHILSRLHEWGVPRVYGYPGDGLNGLMDGPGPHG
jgi:thiamine pyrophosphate-dependent acetolactate synthase large subunit-like protein